jgi:TonB family protein
VVVLAIAGFGFSSAARSETETTEPLPAVERHRAVVTPASNAGSLAGIGAAAAEATRSGSDASGMAKDSQPTPANEMRAAVMPDVPAALQRLRKLVVPKVAMPSVDSLVRAAAKVAPDSLSERIAAGGSLLVPTRSDDATVTAPVLITAPTLRFPDELRAQRVEGEVVVQFRVNEKGRVEPSSMRVMQSEHELFTAAVRSALPRFRFEPARSAAPQSKPQSAWVQFRAQFTARK